jgi:hypothetical protein
MTLTPSSNSSPAHQIGGILRRDRIEKFASSRESHMRLERNEFISNAKQNLINLPIPEEVLGPDEDRYLWNKSHSIEDLGIVFKT